MSDTTRQEPKLLEHTRLQKLVAMLRNTSRNFPATRLIHTQGGFGVLLEDGRCLRVIYSGEWSAEDMRDFLALFATYCVVDFDALLSGYPGRVHGPLLTAEEQRFSRLGRRGSNGSH
jgi:hypothetical protein